MKTVGLLLCIMTLSVAAMSQLYVGPEFGGNIMQVKNEQIGRSFQPGYFGGGQVEYRFNDWLGIKTGLNYSQKRQGYTEYDTTMIQLPGIDLESLGFGDVDMNTYTEMNGRVVQHHIEIPVQARFSYKDYYVAIGGFAGYMLAARKNEYTVSRTPLVSTVDLAAIAEALGQPELAFLIPPAYEDNYSSYSSASGLTRFDFGFKGTIGYQSDHFGFNASYQFGWPDYRTSYEGKRIRHQFVQLSVSYLFQLTGSKESRSSL